jgi:ubiquinol-cytochrome c reductase cytochrome c subunit
MSDKSRRRLHRRLTGAVLLLFGLALAGILAATPRLTSHSPR